MAGCRGVGVPLAMRHCTISFLIFYSLRILPVFAFPSLQHGEDRQLLLRLLSHTGADLC
jgi:hypothetical protein